MGLLALAALALALGGAMVLRTPRATPTPTPAPTPAAAAPVALPLPPAAAARMVVVQTTPAGARVAEASGVELCAATPCAVSVPVGGTRPVVLSLGATRLPVVLDGNSASASVDLAPIAPLPPAVDPTPVATPRPSGNSGHPRTRRPVEEGGGELPMFLPH